MSAIRFETLKRHSEASVSSPPLRGNNKRGRSSGEIVEGKIPGIPGKMNNRRRTTTSMRLAALLLVLLAITCRRAVAFQSHTSARRCSSTTSLQAQISEKEATVAINNVVKALQKDREANEELGRLHKVNNILGCEC